jgi:hypothetical protein
VSDKRDPGRWRNFLCVLIALHFSNMPATSVIAPPFEALVDRAELIFTGQVVSQRSEWRMNNGQKSIVTLVSFSVQQVHKGRASSSITLQFLGGTIGDVSLDVAEIPKFKAGERVVLFVEGNGLNVSPLVGFFHGRFLLQRDKAGRATVFDHNGEPFSLSSAARTKQALTNDSNAAAMTHEEFAAQIRRRVASTIK